MGMFGPLSLTQLMTRSGSVSLEGFGTEMGDISNSLNDSVKQETIVYLLTTKAEVEMRANRTNITKIKDQCLLIASRMLENNDCTHATFSRIQDVIEKMAYRYRMNNLSDNDNVVLDIIDRVMQTKTIGFSKEEVDMLTLFNASRESCSQQATKIVKLLNAHVRRILPSLMNKYPQLSIEALSPKNV